MFKNSQALLLLLAICVGSVAAAVDFSASKWIWTPGRAPDGVTYPPGNSSFRRDYVAPAGKVPISANILMTVDNAYTLFVNGNKIGTGDTFTNAHRYCVRLSSCCNVFAISGQNYQPNLPGNAAGVLAAIQVRFSDGFTETIVSDSEWHAVTGMPAGFEQVAFDDSNWPAAFDEGPYPTTAPWNMPQYALTIPPATNGQNPTSPDLRTANWIWTNELDASGFAPLGGRAFRKTVSLPNGQLVDSATVVIVSDDEYTLYINGLVVGSGATYTAAQRWVVNFPPTSTVVIAVYAENTGGPAGLLAAVELESCDCTDNTFLVTDGSWKTTNGVPSGFIAPGFNDAAWSAARVEGPFGSAPWGQTTIATTNSAASPALPGAPSAPPASVVS
ncbi:hypothetical protein BDQ12DRAFT_716373 [Crucibulum laeve]|uniref:Carbohydrate-binding module family 67 protein n=1 Tax=Crucibulum laeve TaxID=68775 RepID=A0A5C3LI91_9AGAR|nr:hypothetical protein BDQ12DRAFT_716373 [Crucibulum laeve]